MVLSDLEEKQGLMDDLQRRKKTNEGKKRQEFSQKFSGKSQPAVSAIPGD